MVTCKSCKNSDAQVTQFKNMGILCTRCFCKCIEKRVRRELRTQNPLVPHTRIGVLDNGSKEFVVCMHILKGISQEMPLQIIVIKPPIDPGLYDQIVLPWDADDESESGLRRIFDNIDVEFSGLKMLSCVSDAEVMIMAKALGWSRDEEQAHSDYHKFLLETEKKYPGSIFGFVRSTGIIKKLPKGYISVK
ncbi:MAG: hypothetical protein AABX52_04055 [Nanoarchaeota archaeon]